MEGGVDVNWQLEIINAEAWIIKPFVDEVVQHVHIKEGQIVEDLRLFLALDQHLKGIITKIVIAGHINSFIFVPKNGSWSKFMPRNLHGLLLLRLLHLL